MDIPDFTRPHEQTQSTDFTYTRFMIPFINNYKGVSVFCDCDFIFLTDIQILIDSINLTYPVSVVKHPMYIPRTSQKMDNIQQHTMQRKNWASLMVFNNSHPLTQLLTPDYVNSIMPGRKLHTFDWVDESMIGSISLDWNTLDDYYYIESPRAIHYTDGGPWFPQYEKTMYSHLWWKEYNDYQTKQ